MKRLYSDIGTEFLRLCKRFLRTGIAFSTSSLYTPQSNGVYEHMNRTLIGKTKAVIYSAGMDTRFWDEAIMEAAHLYNSTVTPTLGMKTSHEELYGISPDISKIHVFGCAAYPHRHRANRAHKPDQNADTGISLGVRIGLYHILLNKGSIVITTKHVLFNENGYPLKKHNNGITFDDILGQNDCMGEDDKPKDEDD